MALKVVGNSVTLNSGYKMPLLGIGTGQARPSAPGFVAKAVETALDSGYRHIDTAYIYMSEEEVGNGLKNWLRKTGNKREEVFIVTKLPASGMHPEGVEKFLRLSLKNLNLDYVDLYLIHSPVGKKGNIDSDVFSYDDDSKLPLDYGTDHIAIWKEMERMVDLGLTKSIGISNFTIKQTRRLMAISRIPPAVNQVEMHIYFQQNELQEFSRKNNIVLTAYSPLGSPAAIRFLSELNLTMDTTTIVLENPVVKLIADKHHVTPAQILIRYWIEREVVVIPKSFNEGRIKTNGDVFSFTLDETDMKALLLLDKGDKGRIFDFKMIYGNEHPEL